METAGNSRVLRTIPLLLILALFCLSAHAKTVQWSASVGGNGHVYEVVLVPESIIWVDANSLAEQKGGHLATITSQDENDFVFSIINDRQYWNGSGGPLLGGYQLPGSVEPRGGWVWVTGEPFVYSNWGSGQPNNNGNENCIHFGWGGISPEWNDLEDNYTDYSMPIAYVVEFSHRNVYVDDDAAGAGDGTSWTNAYVCLQDALAAARSGDEIRVAQGIYKPDQQFVVSPRSGSQIVASGDRRATFQLINWVTIKGGYAGIAGADPNERNLQEFKTILSGDLDGDDELNFTGNSENSYHVVTGSGTDNTAMLDGFVITGSNANAGMFPDPRCIGGGMYNFTGSPKISNCIFRNNHAFSGGAGMFNSDDSDPLLENCSFIENVTDEDGAGMTNFMGSNPVLKSCDFTGNRAEDHAGGMLNVAESNPVLDRCIFISNSAGTESQRHDGGGMLNDDGSPTLTNCLFVGNTAGRNGGAMHSRGKSNPIILNCTFSENLAGSDGDGIHIQDANATLADCIIWANGFDQIHGEANISYSNVEGGFEGQGNIDADPLFADPNTGDYHLKSEVGRWNPKSGSWIKDDVTSPCIDAGDPNSDFSGETWPHGGRINMGAYGGTRQGSMSLETQDLSLPRVAYIFSRKNEVAESFQSLLGAYGCPTILIRLTEMTATPLDSYDLLIVAEDTQHEDTWSDPNSVAAIEDSGKPVVGLGNGGYDFFGLLGLAIGYPNGAHGSQNSIEVIDPNSSLFRTPYSIEIPEDRTLRLYTETEHVGLYLWPTIPETVTALAADANSFPYYLLATEYNRYLIWGFTESPQKMTEVGKTLFINVVIWTANKAWESDI